MRIVEQFKADWKSSGLPNKPYKTLEEIEMIKNGNLVWAARVEEKLGRKLSPRVTAINSVSCKIHRIFDTLEKEEGISPRLHLPLFLWRRKNNDNIINKFTRKKTV